MENKFSAWLQKEMDNRQWSAADLARNSGVHRSTISLIMSGDRKPGNDFCSAIAHALKLPPETVFRAAGLLPSGPSEGNLSEEEQELLHKYRTASEGKREQMREFMDFLAAQEEKERGRAVRPVGAAKLNPKTQPR